MKLAMALPRTSVQSSTTTPASLIRRTAVVASPDPVSRRTHAECLAGLGLSITEGGTGKDVIRAAEAGELEIAVISLFMPEMDGIETVRYLHRRHPEVRIVVLVNNTHPAFLDLGRVASLLGAHQVLYEPFSPSRLTQAALRVQNRRQARA